ncbi:MAG: hypothetical protein ACXIUM_10110 [Wenzhouxiangella sp.]
MRLFPACSAKRSDFGPSFGPAWVAIAFGAALLAPPALALGNPEREILEDFFILADGPNWLRNDGWLDPETNPCDWFGVECWPTQAAGSVQIRALRLPANQLAGALDTRIFDIVTDDLDLSGNRLSGALERLPGSPWRVDLSANRLSGPLPAAVSDAHPSPSGTEGIRFLDLSRNAFDGEVPETWPGTAWLSLAGNRLEGTPNALLQSQFPGTGRFLDLSDNRFSGIPLPNLDAGNFLDRNTRWGGGLNLCWNAWQLDDPVLIDAIAEVHVGGPDVLACSNRAREPLDIALSGSWYAPERLGEGVVFHQLDEEQALLYWFTFDDVGQQRWLFGLGRLHEFGADWRALQQSFGRFGIGLVADDEQPGMATRGGFRLDRLGAEVLMAERSYVETDIDRECILLFPQPLACVSGGQSDRLVFERATELAGTSCENRTGFEHLSGAWFNPASDGEGFLIEMLEDGRAAVYWFTYQPDDSGAQAWMIGVGDPLIFPGDGPGLGSVVLSIGELFQPVGARFGEAFDPEDIELLEWGSLHFVFADEDSGFVDWSAHSPAFGSGGFEIQRLTRPALASCAD